MKEGRQRFRASSHRKGLLLAIILTAIAAGLVTAADCTVHVMVGYTIMEDEFVELTILSGETVEFGLISEPGTYAPVAGTTLGLRSNRDWVLTDELLLEASTYPAGADPNTMMTTLSRSYQDTGEAAPTWIEIDVAYRFGLTQEDLDKLPDGEYRLVIQFTVATTGT